MKWPRPYIYFAMSVRISRCLESFDYRTTDSSSFPFRCRPRLVSALADCDGSRFPAYAPSLLSSSLWSSTMWTTWNIWFRCSGCIRGIRCHPVRQRRLAVAWDVRCWSGKRIYLILYLYSLEKRSPKLTSLLISTMMHIGGRWCRALRLVIPLSSFEVDDDGNVGWFSSKCSISSLPYQKPVNYIYICTEVQSHHYYSTTYIVQENYIRNANKRA